MMKRITVLCVLFLTIVVFAKPQEVQYIFPLDNSELVARSTEIILRPGARLDASTVSADIFEVVGEKSGVLEGRAKIATDGKTVIFTPNKLYAADENVSVRIKSGLLTQNGQPVPEFNFNFKTTPLEKPINAAKYARELNLLPYVKDIPASLQKSSPQDTLPSDFPKFSIEIPGEPAPGDIFLAPTRMINLQGFQIQLNNQGEIKYWRKYNDGIPFDFTVQPNGLLSYGWLWAFDALGASGPTEFRIMDSTYTDIDQFQMGNGYTADYHEFTYLPNGNALMLAYDIQPVNMNEIVPGGHPGALVGGSIIQELDLDKNVIFQWRSWDHYDLTDSYNDLTQGVIDAIHVNSIDVDDSDGQLIISALALAEVTKINRQNGDIIWRMGGKNNEFTFVNESQEHAPIYFMYQHDVRRLDNGNIMMFDNGDNNLRPRTRIVEYEIDEPGRTATNVWEYWHEPAIYTNNMGSAQRLPNGNTFIGWGFASMYPGTPAITEITPEGEIVFELQFDKPLIANYRARKHVYDGGTPINDVVVAEVQPGNTYTFDQGGAETGMSIKINEKGGFGYNEVLLKQYNYGPINPQFLGVPPNIQPKRFVLDQFAIPSINADLRFDVDFFNIQKPESLVVYYRQFEGSGLFMPVPTQYNPATNQIVATMTNFGEYVFGYPSKDAPAYTPWVVNPKNGAEVDQTKPVRIEWTPVGYISDYTLQVAKDEGFTDLVVNEEFLTAAIYELEVEDNTAYYWRVKAYSPSGDESDWSDPVSFNATAPYINLQIPTGGDQWQRGLEYNLVWNDIIKEDVVIELYKGDAFLALIDTAASTGGYRWGIPLHLDTASDYKIKISSVDNPAVSDISPEGFTITGEATDVDNAPRTPDEFALTQNYPNPFNPTTTIAYQLPQAAQVELTVYDLRGSRVATLVNDYQTAGEYQIQFDGADFPSGMYFYTIKAGADFSETRKMLLVK